MTLFMTVFAGIVYAMMCLLMAEIVPADYKRQSVIGDIYLTALILAWPILVISLFVTMLTTRKRRA